MFIKYSNTVIISVLYNTWEFVKLFCRIQSKSTFNPLYANTSTLCHCANLKSLGKFCEKFSVNTYGIFKIKTFNSVKMISFMKLIFEDIIQFIIQVLFLVFLKGGDFSEMLFLSIVFSVLSFTSCLYIIRYDNSAGLSLEDVEPLKQKYENIPNVYKAFRRSEEQNTDVEDIDGAQMANL